MKTRIRITKEERSARWEAVSRFVTLLALFTAGAATGAMLQRSQDREYVERVDQDFREVNDRIFECQSDHVKTMRALAECTAARSECEDVVDAASVMLGIKERDEH